MSNVIQMCCSTCGGTEGSIIRIGSVNICQKCSDSLHEAFHDESDPVIHAGEKPTITPSKITEFVDQYVIGQDSAKRTLAIAIYNHYKRLNNPVLDGVELQKSNILIAGPSGSGKTHLVSSIAKLLDVPFVIADATVLTEAGFVGSDVESILHRLISVAGNDIEKAQRGIVFIDEVDKIAKKEVGASLTKDPGGEGVQQALLKLIEGSEVEVQIAGGRRTSGSATNVIDTTNILFVVSGAFVGLDDIIKQRSQRGTNLGIGFSAAVEHEIEDTGKIEPEDLVKFGLIPEFIGRLPVVTKLNPLTRDDLVRILTEPKNSIVKQFQALYRVDNSDLVFSDAALNKIADIAEKRESGARGLRSIVEDVLSAAAYAVPDLDQSKVMVDVVDGELKTTIE